ncbi:MAG TPA: sulfatase [Bryobacteraceae bacterium]|jgi:arylsulfatase A-like enzyme|nr:sulfatase [Bryobacteraceae bacterium]
MFVSRRQALAQVLATGAAFGSSLNPERRRPNILFFLTDDQRRDAMSAYGNKILYTPNLDRIAASGTRFELGFATNALCRPSRASILTGQYSHSHQVLTNGDGRDLPGRDGLRRDQITFPQIFRQNGYWTALAGKWHLASEPGGFDEYAILPGQGIYLDPPMIVNGAHVQFRGHVEDVVGDQTIHMLEHRPKGKPFCMLSHFKAPHREWIPAARFADRFADVHIPEPRTFNDTLAGRPKAVRDAEDKLVDLPDFRDRGCPDSLTRAERKECNLQQLVKNYYRVLLGVDENVGRILDYLQDEGELENTIVVYTSDNGFFLGDHGLMDKRLMYEESIAVPFVIAWPAAMPKGVVDDKHLVINCDFAPTLLDLAGLPIPGSMQGKSLKPLLEGKNVPDWRASILCEYFEYPAVHCVRMNRGIRTHDWKLIHFWQDPQEWELYNLRDDPGETRNLAADPKYRQTLDELKQRLQQLREETHDVDLPSADPGPCEFGISGDGPKRSG